MNPAVAIGLTLMEVFATDNPNKIYTHYLYAYTLGPAVGGLMAGVFGLLLKKLHDEGNQRENEPSFKTDMNS